jgi:tetratricopeptide (TPR) repeat protein
MFPQVSKCVRFFVLLACSVLLPADVFAQRPGSPPGGRGSNGVGPPFANQNVKIYLQTANGGPVDQLAVVILTAMTGQNVQQATTHAGWAQFSDVAPGSYNVEVVAPGYERAVERLDLASSGASVLTITLEPSPDGHLAVAPLGPPILAPKAKKELGKALEAMRANKPTEARGHLDAAYRLAPGNPEVNYVFGIYSSQVNDWASAKTYWEKVLSLYPKHGGALVSMGIALLRENKPVDAEPYLKGAVQAEPSSWRAHALLADACLQQGALDEAIAHAERAVELGHGQAAVAQPLLARALAKRGDKERAIQVLQTYLQDHSGDAAAAKQLENLRVLPVATPAADAPVAVANSIPTSAPPLETSILPIPSSWLPPDVDEKIPPVESGAACALDEVMKKAGKRVQEFVGNVDRFTATEFITHESINKWGVASLPEKFKFDYLVSIYEIGPGLLNVDESRPRAYSLARFPDGVESHGLPALVLIFHPYNAVNYEMTCEGLTHWNGGLAWQVHFRQRPDRPNTIRVYRFTESGSAHPAALKGRAWIAADSFQILRLETDLIAPLPQIRLLADHSSVEYGPVNFRARNVDMWLPKTAELFYDWRGRRSHRSHLFTNYLLFSVDEKQRISAPKDESAP